MQPNQTTTTDNSQQTLNAQKPKVKIKASVTDTFISTSYNAILGLGVGVAGSKTLKKFEKDLAKNFATMQGGNIIANSPLIAIAKENYLNVNTKFMQVQSPHDMRQLAVPLTESLQNLNTELIKDSETKEYTFWMLVFLGYLVGGASRNLSAVFLDKTGLHIKLQKTKFFAKGTKEEAEQAQNTIHWITKNVIGVVAGGIVGLLWGLGTSRLFGSGDSPKWTGFWFGATSALAGCVAAELQDYSIASKIEIENNQTSGNNQSSLPQPKI